MNILKKAILTAFAIGATITAAAAGEVHEGYGTTKIDAIAQANEFAEAKAESKGTCWKPAKMEACKQDKDGYWTAYAESANHSGSCGKDGYIKPKKKK
jgi:hypothetical protein